MKDFIVGCLVIAVVAGIVGSVIGDEQKPEQKPDPDIYLTEAMEMATCAGFYLAIEEESGFIIADVLADSFIVSAGNLSSERDLLAEYWLDDKVRKSEKVAKHAIANSGLDAVIAHAKKLCVKYIN